MSKLELNGRQVEVDEMEFGRDADESLIVSAYFVDTEEELNEEELQQLTDDNGDWLYLQWQEHMISEADFLYDSYKDGSY